MNIKEYHQGSVFSDEKKKVRISKLCKRLVINNLLCISMTTNNILLFVAKNEGLTKFADKLIYSGFLLSVGAIASLFSLLNSFPEKNNYRSDKDVNKYIKKTFKEDAKFEKDFHKYMEKQIKKER